MVTGKRRKPKRHHNCPVDDCQIGLPVDVLMCPPHWRSVPKLLRHDVTRAWGRARTLLGKPRRLAVTDYLAARAAAVLYANTAAAQ